MSETGVYCIGYLTNEHWLLVYITVQMLPVQNKRREPGLLGRPPRRGMDLRTSAHTILRLEPVGAVLNAPNPRPTPLASPSLGVHATQVLEFPQCMAQANNHVAGRRGSLPRTAAPILSNRAPPCSFPILAPNCNFPDKALLSFGRP